MGLQNIFFWDREALITGEPLMSQKSKYIMVDVNWEDKLRKSLDGSLCNMFVILFLSNKSVWKVSKEKKTLQEKKITELNSGKGQVT